MAKISKGNLAFLTDLRNNNNKEWFEQNKSVYQQFHKETVEFADDVLAKMQALDSIETPSGKKSIYRIYRDVRFSKDKTPYKSHWGGILKRATEALRGTYYFHIEPEKCFVGGGFWGPNSQDLKRIRAEFDLDGDEFRKIITDDVFVKTFGELKGEQVKSAPKGYKKDHPQIDLLRYKQFLISKEFSNKEVLADNFSEQVVDTFQKMRPFFDYMSMVLTTNLNGESLLED